MDHMIRSLKTFNLIPGLIPLPLDYRAYPTPYVTLSPTAVSVLQGEGEKTDAPKSNGRGEKTDAEDKGDDAATDGSKGAQPAESADDAWEQMDDNFLLGDDQEEETGSEKRTVGVTE